MKTLTKYVFTLLLIVPFVVFAQNEPLPSAGITPESPFYFIDKFGEAVRSLLTFSKIGKARLQVVFAAERIAEIKVILEDKGVEAKGLEEAEYRLKANLEKVNVILADEKKNGRDVSSLAKELDDDFEGPRSALKEALKTEKKALEAKEQELKLKIRDARQAGDAVLVDTLIKELNGIKIQKELLGKKEDKHDEELGQEEDKLESEMGDKAEAEEAIMDAEKERIETIKDTTEDGVVIPALIFEKFDRLVLQAKELLAKGNYQGAEQLAEQAKKSLEKEKDKYESLKEEKIKKEDLEDEKEQDKFEKDQDEDQEQDENDDLEDDDSDLPEETD